MYILLHYLFQQFKKSSPQPGTGLYSDGARISRSVPVSMVFNLPTQREGEAELTWALNTAD